jgi:uncharacterized protein (DUF1501 family)
MIYIYDGDRWDHHAGIFDKTAEWNHYRTCTRLDKGLVSLIHDLAKAPGSTAGKTLLDETMIVCQSEFGRTPGMNPVNGRDHWKGAYTGLYVGGGIAGGRILGSTTADGSAVVDWTKVVENTPSGRAYHYVDTVSLGGAAMMEADEIGDLFA